MVQEDNGRPQECEETKTEGQTTAAPEPVDVWQLLRYCLVLFHSHAWQSMGLLPDPTTGKTARDLQQAQVAIDTAAYIAGQLESRLEGRELHDLQAMVADLRMNFVQQRKAADKPDQGAN
jgi:hypothetical protein